MHGVPIAHGRQRPRSTNAVPMLTGGLPSYPVLRAGVSRPIAPVGQTSPQRVQANSHHPRRGTTTGVQKPSTPAWPIAGWIAPVGQACWQSEHFTQRCRNSASPSEPGGRSRRGRAASRPPPVARRSGATAIDPSTVPTR